MNGVVVSAVLGAAILHGSWNAIAKRIPDRLVSSALIGLTYLGAGLIGALFLPPPDPGSWPMLVISAVIQTAYLILLTAAYAKTDFSQAYPLTRGLSVVGVTIVSATLLGESLTVVQSIGITVVAVALISLAWAGGGGAPRSGILLAVTVSIAITAYSVIDGVGVRESGNPLSYAAWLFIIQGVTVPIACVILERNRKNFVRGLARHAGIGSIGGVLSLVAYTIVVWAQSIAPLALVSALRESGVLAAGVLGFLFFREPFSKWRIAATIIAVAGIIAVKLG